MTTRAHGALRNVAGYLRQLLVDRLQPRTDALVVVQRDNAREERALRVSVAV